MKKDLLKQDFIQGMASRLTRTEAEVIANRVVDLLEEMIEDMTVKLLIEHCSTYDHVLGEE